MQQELTASQAECVLHTEKASQLEEALSQVQSEHAICMSQKALEQLVAALKEELEESRKRADEMQSLEAELKEDVQEAVREKSSAEEMAKSLQARLEQKENELRRRQDERREAAKAATDAEEEAKKLRSEKQGTFFVRFLLRRSWPFAWLFPLLTYSVPKFLSFKAGWKQRGHFRLLRQNYSKMQNWCSKS